MIYVIDIDNTISKWDANRDYANFVPISPVVEKINQLFDAGNTIILFTARGMKFYNGDLQKIEKYNRPIIEDWLRKHNVNYTELVLGKPFADFYIDDKNLSIEDFINNDYN